MRSRPVDQLIRRIAWDKPPKKRNAGFFERPEHRQIHPFDDAVDWLKNKADPLFFSIPEQLVFASYGQEACQQKAEQQKNFGEEAWDRKVRDSAATDYRFTADATRQAQADRCARF
jgi:hypothetical protein